MLLTSAAFESGEEIPSKYTCAGLNISPPLTIQNVPENTKSFALIFEHREAPYPGSVHWVVFNIPADIREIKEGETPMNAVSGVVEPGKRGYNGPCLENTQGIHHFEFTLFALDSFLKIPTQSDRDAVSIAMNNHVLGVANLIGVIDKK